MPTPDPQLKLEVLMLQRMTGWLAAVMAILTLSNSPGMAADRSHAGDDRRASFAVIEQPLGVKLGAIAGGIALASLELWWFLGVREASRRDYRRQDR